MYDSTNVYFNILRILNEVSKVPFFPTPISYLLYSDRYLTFDKFESLPSVSRSGENPNLYS